MIAAWASVEFGKAAPSYPVEMALQPVRPFQRFQPPPAKGGGRLPFVIALIGALTVPLLGMLLGALTLESFSKAPNWVGALAALLGALVVPSAIALKLGKRLRVAVWIFLVCNLVALAALLGLKPVSSALALAHHGEWPLELAGRSSERWRPAIHAVAGWLVPGEASSLIFEAPDAGAPANVSAPGDAAMANADTGVDAGAPADAAPEGPLTAPTIFERAAPAVVVISARNKSHPMEESLGSGFVVSNGGPITPATPRPTSRPQGRETFKAAS